MTCERFVIGKSEDVEAEYGSRDDAPVTLLSMIDDEIFSVEGFSTIERAKLHLHKEQVSPMQIEILG
jgi:hypothetical protein